MFKFTKEKATFRNREKFKEKELNVYSESQVKKDIKMTKLMGY